MLKFIKSWLIHASESPANTGGTIFFLAGMISVMGFFAGWIAWAFTDVPALEVLLKCSPVITPYMISAALYYFLEYRDRD